MFYSYKLRYVWYPKTSAVYVWLETCICINNYLLKVTSAHSDTFALSLQAMSSWCLIIIIYVIKHATLVYVPHNDYCTTVNIVLLICEVEDVDIGSVHLSAYVHNLCLILNVQLEFTGVILQILNLNKTKLNSMHL